MGEFGTARKRAAAWPGQPAAGLDDASAKTREERGAIARRKTPDGRRQEHPAFPSGYRREKIRSARRPIFAKPIPPNREGF